MLPVRHVLVLRDKAADAHIEAPSGDIPGWVQDYALFLLDVDGNIVAWYSGAERIYGYTGAEAIGKQWVCCTRRKTTLHARLRKN